MTFKDWFRQLSGASAPHAVFARLHQASPTVDSQSIEEAVSAISKAIERNQIGRALTAARVLLLAGPAKTLSRLRRHGLLRASRYGFTVAVIDAIVADWIAHAQVYGLSQSDVQYLRSVQALRSLAPALRTVSLQIERRLRERRSQVIKSLLAEVDAAFANGTPVDVGDDMPRWLTPEELAEGFSYLLGVFHDKVGLAAERFALIDSEVGYDPGLLALLADAVAVCRYREAEVLLDGFPYQAQRHGDEVRVSAIDPALERSIRLGYIQYELQGYVHDQTMHQVRDATGDISLRAFADRYFEIAGDAACTLRTAVTPRYTLRIPVEGPAAEFLASDALLLEDMSCCERLGWEDYIEPAAVPAQVVSGNVTVLDLLKVQRMFRFMHHGLQRAMHRHPSVSDRAGLYRASCLPVLPRERMLAMLALAVGAGKADEVLRLLSADPSNPAFDIQYAPILCAGRYCMVSLAITASANLPRNVLSRIKQRLIPAAPGQSCPMQTTLAQALRGSGFLVREEVHIAFGKDKLEVDVLAWRDGHLFVFECKNNFHPCSVYEMRNTYDAMQGAARQLAKRRRWLADPENQRTLCASLGWPDTALAGVHTCIALGNRIFNGYECSGHPVRQAHELLNVLQRGYIEFHDGGRSRFWLRDTFTVDDLLGYLAGTTTHADMHAAMEPSPVVTPMGALRMVHETFALDGTTLIDTVMARYPRAPVLAQGCPVSSQAK